MDWLNQLPQYTLFAISILIFVGVGFAIRHGIVKFVTRKVTVEFARIIIRNLSTALIVWSALAGINFGMQFLEIPANLVGYVTQAIFIIGALSVTIVLAYIFSDLLKSWTVKLGPQIAPMSGLGQFVVKLVILGIGLMVILGSLGVNITPMLASLGIGALAIALALQPTLANLFAGLYIMADKPVRIGDFVRLETGEEGYVEDIGWRSVRIRMLPNNVVIVPNQKLVDSIVLNYYYPAPKLALLIEVGVSYEDDPVKVEKILVEEMVKASFEVDGMVTAYEAKPFVRFIPGYMDFSLNFTLICQVREVVDRYYVQHELRKRIWERFKKEGITIPFPIRTLHFHSRYIKDLEELEFSTAKG